MDALHTPKLLTASTFPLQFFNVIPYGYVDICKSPVFFGIWVKTVRFLDNHSRNKYPCAIITLSSRLITKHTTCQTLLNVDNNCRIHRTMSKPFPYYSTSVIDLSEWSKHWLQHKLGYFVMLWYNSLLQIHNSALFICLDVKWQSLRAIGAICCKGNKCRALELFRLVDRYVVKTDKFAFGRGV